MMSKERTVMTIEQLNTIEEDLRARQRETEKALELTTELRRTMNRPVTRWETGTCATEEIIYPSAEMLEVRVG
jgi:hypothetical protein